MYDAQKYPLIWMRTSRQGYNFTARIPCRAIELTKSKKRVRIAASLKDGTERIHVVKCESLEHFSKLAHETARILQNLPSRR